MQLGTYYGSFGFKGPGGKNRWSDRFVNPNDYDNDNPEKVEGIRTRRISF